MGRRPCCRRVAGNPSSTRFGPDSEAIGPAIELALDEFESLRLADVEGLYQADAAAQMGVSRATFGRIVGAARHKVATALLNGQELVIGGGHVRLGRSQRYRCQSCHHHWEGEGETMVRDRCPRCCPPHGGE